MSERADLRIQLDTLLPGASDLEALLVDYFPDVYRRASADPDRQAKLNRLLSEVEIELIQTAVRSYQDRAGRTPSSSSHLAQTVVSIRPDGSIRWSGIPADQVVQHAWGTPAGGEGKPIALQCHWRYPKQESLSRALVRLAVHGGVRSFAASAHSVWNDKHTAELKDCIGFLSAQEWRATQGAPFGQTGWCFSEAPNLAPENNPLHLAGFVHLAESLPATLHHAMNQWVLERLDTEMELVIHLDPQKYLGRTYHPDYLNWMKVVWPHWHKLLKESPALLQHVLACTLTPPDSLSEVAGAGLLRVGPRTIRSCLLPAFVFALVIDAALSPSAANIAPRHRPPPGNFELLDRDVQLVGLQLFHRQELATMLLRQMWAWGTPIVLLPHEKQSLIELRNELSNQRRIGAPPNSFERFTRKPLAEALITQDYKILSLLEMPPDEVRNYVMKELQSLNQRLQEDIEHAVQRSIGSKTLA